MERRLWLQDCIRGLERGCEGLDLEERAVARRVHVREVEDGADPAAAASDRDHVVEAAEVVDAAHHLDAERHRAVFALEPLPELGQLLADGLDRRRPRASQQKAGMEDDDLGAGRLRDPR